MQLNVSVAFSSYKSNLLYMPGGLLKGGPHERVDEFFDACFMPRTFHITGSLDANDFVVDKDGRIIFVNTRFNSLTTVSPGPPDVAELVTYDKEIADAFLQNSQ